MATYKYSYHEERGEFHGYVEDRNGRVVWEVNYPDFYEDIQTGELIEASTIFHDGFLAGVDDVEGLEDYLKSLHILKAGDELIADNDEYARGGETKFKKVRTLAEAKKDPRVENIYFEPDDYREISGSWWLELKEGYICRSMSCGTIHEDTLKEVLDLLNTDVVEGSEFARGGNINTYKAVFYTDKGGEIIETKNYKKHPTNLTITRDAKKLKSRLIVLYKNDVVEGYWDYYDGRYGWRWGFGMGKTFARGGRTPEYETYHETLASVLDEAEDYITKKGYRFTDDSYFPDVTNGGIPYGVTQRVTRDVEEVAGKQRQNTLILTIYRMDSGRYELVMFLTRTKYASGGSIENKLKKKLSQSFELPMEMAVYVPSTDKANVIISKRDYASRIEEVEKYLSELFGGYSAVSVDGGYVSDDKGLIQEDVTRVATFGSTENFESKFTTLTKKVVDWCNKWGQESMGFEFEGDMFYIDKKASFKDGGGVDDKKVIELTPIYTIRDKKGFRFYSTDDGKQLYAEKNGDIYNVNEDTLKPTTIIPLQRTRFKFVGLINDNDVKDLNPLHYERETQKRIEKSFGMANGGEIESNFIKTLKDEISDIFPESYVQVSVKRFLDEPSVYILFLLGKDKDEWKNQIYNNDDAIQSIIVNNVDDKGNPKGILDVHSSTAGRITITSTNRMYAFESIKVGWRNFKADEKQSINRIVKYFEKLKQLLIDNFDKLTPYTQNLMIQKNYIKK